MRHGPVQGPARGLPVLAGKTPVDEADAERPAFVAGLLAEPQGLLAVRRNLGLHAQALQYLAEEGAGKRAVVHDEDAGLVERVGRQQTPQLGVSQHAEHRRKNEIAPLFRDAFHANVAVHTFNELFADGQPEAGAPVAAGCGAVRLRE